ncbi:MAG: hypothetical protein ACKO3T_28300 [Planctomycetaceae bacterium]
MGNAATDLVGAAGLPGVLSEAVPGVRPAAGVRPAVTEGETLIDVSSAALAADRARLQEAELQRIDRERQLQLARERELARFD